MIIIIVIEIIRIGKRGRQSGRTGKRKRDYTDNSLRGLRLLHEGTLEVLASSSVRSLGKT